MGSGERSEGAGVAWKEFGSCSGRRKRSSISPPPQIFAFIREQEKLQAHKNQCVHVLISERSANTTQQTQTEAPDVCGHTDHGDLFRKRRQPSMSARPTFCYRQLTVGFFFVAGHQVLHERGVSLNHWWYFHFKSAPVTLHPCQPHTRRRPPLSSPQIPPVCTAEVRVGLF